MNKQEIFLVAVLTVLLFTPMIAIGWKMYQIEKWFQRVEQRIDKAGKRLSK